MQLDFNVFSVILIFSGIGVGFLSVFVFFKIAEAAKYFAYTMLSVSLWAFAYGFELASSNLEEMLFWIKVEYLGIAMAPGTWLLFCLKYSGKDHWLKKQVLCYIFVIPLVTLLLVWTNGWHFLYYKSVEVSTAGPFPLLALQPGPWYFLHTFYFYFTIFIGTYLLISGIKHYDSTYRRATFLLVFSVILPWLVNIGYLMGYKPFGYLDLTPFAFVFSCAIIGVGLAKFHLFKVVPIAKEKLIAAMTEGVFVIDINGRVMDLNPSMIKILGKNHRKYIGQPVSIFLGMQNDLMEVIADRAYKELEIKSAFNQLNREYSVEAIPLYEKQNKFRGMLLIFKDVTEEKQNQNLLKIQSDYLKHHNGLKDKLFSIISHDLKGPIMGVKEIIDMMKQGLLTADEFDEIISELSKSIDGVTMLLENLLAWSRSQMKGEFMEKVNIDIHKLIQEQKYLMNTVAVSKKIDVGIHSEGKVMVFADKNMVELVIRNLLNNAIKFSEKGDKVLFIIIKENNEAKISIRDTGVGISKSNLSRLRQGDWFSTFGSHNESGTGLGLLLVRDYVEKNGGSLYIESEEHKGSEFSFKLPLAESVVDRQNGVQS